jgi:hypothetical protein
VVESRADLFESAPAGSGIRVTELYLVTPCPLAMQDKGAKEGP